MNNHKNINENENENENENDIDNEKKKHKKSCSYCIKMESQKIINSLEKTSDNKDLPKKKNQ